MWNSCSTHRSLILHADDFGMNAAVTHGIIEAFSDGLLTSTSLLANAPAAELAVTEWQKLEDARRKDTLASAERRRGLGDDASPFDLGVHLNLTQGRPLTGPIFPAELHDHAGRFLSPGRLFLRLRASGRAWRAAIERELAAQIEWLVVRGIQPTHLNGHQYVEMMPVVSELVPLLAERYGISYIRAASEPGHWLTSLTPGWRASNWCLSFVKRHYADRWRRTLDTAGIAHADDFFGASHAGLIDVRLMRRFLRLARNHTLLEIALHPGRSPDQRAGDSQVDGWRDPLAFDRLGELQVLCSPALADLIASENMLLGRLSRPNLGQSRAA
ncbi:MAG: carbohydrate deacetylase [Pirellulales bacterium]